jgi:hypothetical protein
MKKIYFIFALLFSLLILGNQVDNQFKAEDLEPAVIDIAVNEKLPTTFIMGSEMPNFKSYFVVKVNNTSRNVIDDEIDLTSFNINQVGDYTITVTIVAGTSTKSHTLDVKVVLEDVTAPTVTLSKPFIFNDFGQIAWDSRESMIKLMERFQIFDDVDGVILASEEMFEGIEKVRLNNYDHEYSIFVSIKDKAGNEFFYGELRLLIINTIGSVIVEVDEELPLEFVKGSESPDFKKYFSITDNVTVVEVTEDLIRLGGFDINKVGTYNVSIIYSRPYVFDTNRDLKNVRITVKVIEEDLTPPNIITYKIDDEMNIDGKLPWTYKDSLDILIGRFSVKDNVDGQIPVTREMFQGIDLVDITNIDTEYLITFTVVDSSGNIATKEINLLVLDNVSPYITNFNNRYYSSNKNINILNVANEVGALDNYDENDNILKIVLNNPDMFEKVQMSYMELERYKDRFTEAEIAAAAKSYNYVLKDGTYTVSAKAFYNDKQNDLVADKSIEIVVLNGRIVGLEKVYEALGLDREDNMVMYYLTNFEPKKNGEFVVVAEAYDTSSNRAPIRPFRIVIENGPSLALILLIINLAAFVIFGGGIGTYFTVKAVKKGKEVNHE